MLVSDVNSSALCWVFSSFMSTFSSCTALINPLQVASPVFIHAAIMAISFLSVSVLSASISLRICTGILRYIPIVYHRVETGRRHWWTSFMLAETTLPSFPYFLTASWNARFMDVLSFLPCLLRYKLMLEMQWMGPFEYHDQVGVVSNEAICC